METKIASIELENAFGRTFRRDIFFADGVVYLDNGDGGVEELAQATGLEDAVRYVYQVYNSPVWKLETEALDTYVVCPIRVEAA